MGKIIAKLDYKPSLPVCPADGCNLFFILKKVCVPNVSTKQLFVAHQSLYSHYLSNEKDVLFVKAPFNLFVSEQNHSPSDIDWFALLVTVVSHFYENAFI